MSALPKRPFPSAALFEEDLGGAFARAKDVEEWVKEHFIDPGGVFFSETHEPLADAYVGVLWATKEVKRKGVALIGTAEMPSRSVGHMSGFAKELWLWQMRRWFATEDEPDKIPDFLITLNATWAAECEDVEFCAGCKHEVLHCRQATVDGTADGSLWFKRDGSRVWTIWPHDAETFVEIAEDFGAVERGVSELAAALARPPRFGASEIKIACGVGMARAA